MVKRYENNTGVLKSINEINSTSTNLGTRTNGNSYADSLKIDLKKQQQQSSANEEDYNSTSNDYNGNGLLNELVVNVSSNVQSNSKSFTNNKQQLNNSSSQFAHSTTATTTTTKSINNNYKIDVKKRATLFNETSKSPNYKPEQAEAIISTLLAKNSTSTKKEFDNMSYDCFKRKIRTHLNEDNDFIEIAFFIKSIFKDTLKVDFEERSLGFKFKTTDPTFLRAHDLRPEQFRPSLVTHHRITNGTINGVLTEENKFSQLKPEINKSKLPSFIYTIETLVDKIIPSKCTYELSETQLKLKLRKKIAIKWNEIELVKNEMCVNYLKNIANVQKDNNEFKYKSNKLTNVNKLASNYEKIINNNDKKEDANEEEANNNKGDNHQKEQNNYEIPIAPPLPTYDKKQHYSYRNKLNGDLNNKKQETKEGFDEFFNYLNISPVKENKNENDTNTNNEDTVDNSHNKNQRKSIPFSFCANWNDDDDDTEQQQQSTSKPIEKTQSLKLNLAELRGKIGYTGLSNLGNTCYMNSCLQCLSNTAELRDYFLTEQYKDDLNKENPFGSGGHLAEAFSEVLYKLWSGESSYFSPSRFKRLIDENCSQFIGYSQHDSGITTSRLYYYFIVLIY